MCLLGIQYAVIAISVIISCAVPLSFRAYIRATPEQIEDMSPSYGWWLPSKGNLSVFSPEVVNRTDWNVSSPTYGMWTPPPGERFRCSQSLPRSAPIARAHQHTLTSMFAMVAIAAQSGASIASGLGACQKVCAPTSSMTSSQCS